MITVQTAMLASTYGNLLAAAYYVNVHWDCVGKVNVYAGNKASAHAKSAGVIAITNVMGSPRSKALMSKM